MRWAEKPVFHVKHRGCEAFRCSSAAIAQDSAKTVTEAGMLVRHDSAISSHAAAPYHFRRANGKFTISSYCGC